MKEKFALVPRLLPESNFWRNLYPKQKLIVIMYFLRARSSGVVKVDGAEFADACGLSFDEEFRRLFMDLFDRENQFYYDAETGEMVWIRFPSVYFENVINRELDVELSEVQSANLLGMIVVNNYTAIVGLYRKRMKQILDNQ